MKQLNWICAFALLGCMAACDDDDDNTDMNNDTNNLQAEDKTFVQNASLNNMTEIDFGTMASSMGESELVKSFGQDMVTEHTMAQEDLESMADDFTNISWPSELDQSHKQKRQQLMTLTGHAFDSAYMASQVADHQMALDLFENAADSADHDDVQAYAEKYRPYIQEHLERADSIFNAIVGNNNENDSTDTGTDAGN